MNKKIKILIVGLVLLIGSNVKAENWGDFMSIVQGGSNQTIDFNVTPYPNPLVWQNNLTVGGNHTFIGFLGNDFAILDGDATYRGFFISYKTIHFQDNFEFRNFYTSMDGGAMWVHGSSSGDPANINFTNSVVNFTSNTSRDGGAIGVGSLSNINFTNSMVTFIGNTAVRWDG